MKKLFSLLLTVLFLTPMMVQAKNDEALIPEYQVEGAGKASNGSPQIKVIILSKKKNVSDADFSKCAVHAILFRDYDDKSNTGFGSVAHHRAVMGSPTAIQQHIDFFEPFFRNGDCNNYVQIVGDTRRVVKVGKQWKVSSEVRVNERQLRKDLEKQGYLKNLGTGW